MWRAGVASVTGKRMFIPGILFPGSGSRSLLETENSFLASFSQTEAALFHSKLNVYRVARILLPGSGSIHSLKTECIFIPRILLPGKLPGSGRGAKKRGEGLYLNRFAVGEELEDT